MSFTGITKTQSIDRLLSNISYMAARVGHLLRICQTGVSGGQLRGMGLHEFCLILLQLPVIISGRILNPNYTNCPQI